MLEVFGSNSDDQVVATASPCDVSASAFTANAAERSDGVQVSDFPPAQALANTEELVWDDDNFPIDNYVELGNRLAATGDLYRRPGYVSGLLLASDSRNIQPITIEKGSRLAAIIADRVRIRFISDGKPKGNHVPGHHLNTMLACEAFLQCFRPVDDVVK